MFHFSLEKMILGVTYRLIIIVVTVPELLNKNSRD